MNNDNQSLLIFAAIIAFALAAKFLPLAVSSSHAVIQERLAMAFLPVAAFFAWRSHV